jgi:hypothetical protein
MKETQMPRDDIETVHHDGKWHNKVQGNAGSKDTSHDTKEEAVRAGREMARQAQVEHIIKNKDGTIAQRNTYGQDPRNVRG